MLQQDQSVSARYFLLMLLALVVIGHSGCADQKAEQRVEQSSEERVVQISEQPDEFYGSGFDPRSRRSGTTPTGDTRVVFTPLADRWIDVPADFDKEYFEVLDGYPVLARFEYPGEQNWPHRLQNPRGKILGKHTIGSDDLLIVEVVVGRERLVQGLCIYELIDQTAVLRYVWDNKITDQVGDTSVIIKSNKINLTRRFPIIFQKPTYSYYSVFDPHHHRLIPRLSYNSLPYFATLPWPPKYQEVLDDEEGAVIPCEPIILE